MNKLKTDNQCYLTLWLMHFFIVIYPFMSLTGFVQETRHKNQGLFQDFPAPNKIFPGPFVFNL